MESTPVTTTADPTRSRTIRRRVVLLISGAVLGAVAVTAVAATSFTDVPDGHVFGDDITWLADADVTRGCNPPANTRFCPDEPVTRGQMAAFLHRFADAGVVDAASLGGQDASAFALASQLEEMATTPGPAGEDGASAYEMAVESGFEGTEEEWLESLMGPAGPTGPEGPAGPKGDSSGVAILGAQVYSLRAGTYDPNGPGSLEAERIGVGRYRITFDRPTEGCLTSATPRMNDPFSAYNPDIQGVPVAVNTFHPFEANDIIVETYDGGAGGPMDYGIDVVLICGT